MRRRRQQKIFCLMQTVELPYVWSKNHVPLWLQVSRNPLFQTYAHRADCSLRGCAATLFNQIDGQTRDGYGCVAAQSTSGPRNRAQAGKLSGLAASGMRIVSSNEKEREKKKFDPSGGRGENRTREMATFEGIEYKLRRCRCHTEDKSTVRAGSTDEDFAEPRLRDNSWTRFLI